MSQKLPVINGWEVVRALEKTGFVLVPGRGKGSHMVLKRAGFQGLLTVPDHSPVKRGTLRAIIRNAGLSVDEFVALL